MRAIIVTAICLLSFPYVLAQNHSELGAIKFEIVKTYMDLQLQAPNPNEDFSIYQNNDHEIVIVTTPQSQPASLFIYDKIKSNWVQSHKFMEFNANGTKESKSATKNNVAVLPYGNDYLITCEVSSGDNRNFKQWIEVYNFSNDSFNFVGKIDFFEFHQSDIYPIKKINYSGFYEFSNSKNKSIAPIIIINKTYNDGINEIIKYKLNAPKDKYVIWDTLTIPSDSKLLGKN